MVRAELPAPKWFRRIDAFLLHSCSIVFIQTLTLSGYLNGISTTLERRFKLTTHEIGLVYMWFEVTCTPGTILFGIFGRKLHRPRMIGIFSFIISLGMFLFTIPHFITPNYNIKICQEYYNNSICMKSGSSFRNIAKRSSVLNEKCEDMDTNSRISLYFFCLGTAILGLGTSPLFVLCPAHLWDNLEVREYSIYSAIFYITIGLGSPFGFIVSGAILNLFIDIPIPPTCPQITPKHSLWLGAWWVGLLIMGTLMMILAIPMIKFDRNTVPRKRIPIAAPSTSDDLKMIEKGKDTFNNNENQEEISHVELKRSCFDLLKNTYLKESFNNLYDLMKNKIWIFITLMNVMEQSVVLACVTFISKYIQMVFGIPVADASFVVAAIIVPGVALGLVVGGVLMRRIQPSFVTVSKTLLTLLVITTLILVFLMSLRCQNNYYYKAEIKSEDQKSLLTAFKKTLINFLQKTIGQNKYLVKLLQQNKRDIKPTHIDNECNSKCLCDLSMYEPLCDMNNSVNYYSPCHAGCNLVIVNNGEPSNQSLLPSIGQLWYTNCTCAPNSTILVSGRCRSYCASYYVLFFFMIITVFFTSLGQVPTNVVTLSIVPPSYSSIALGVQMFSIHVLAFIPIPIIFGVLFDYACVLQFAEKCSLGSVCNEYDLNKLPYVWLGSIIIMKLMSIIFCSTSFILSRKKPHLNDSLQSVRQSGIVIS